MKTNQKVILAIFIGILCVIGIVSSSTYALWRITKTQVTPNQIVAACLDLTIENESGTYGIDDAWPMSDEEGMNLSGYTFEVKNNCQTEINYVVGLNALGSSTVNYLSHDYLKLQIDDNAPVNYGALNDLDAINVLASKMINRETIKPNATNTHTIKMWLDIDTPVKEQNKEFEGQVFITGGEGIRTNESCFTIANNGTIMSYDELCGLSVYVPNTINDIDVKEINFMSFSPGEFIELVGTNLKSNKPVNFIYYKDQTHKQEIEAYYKETKCEDLSNCNLEDYMIIINDYDEYLTYNWNEYNIYSYRHYNYDAENHALITMPAKITSLNLGDAKKLEKINQYAFNNFKLKSLILPQNGSLKIIDESAFNLNNLKKVDLSNTLQEIKEAAFNGNSIENIKIPASVKEIGISAFNGNKAKYVFFEDTESSPSQLTLIGESAFRNNNLDKIVFPSSLKVIDDFAFMTSYLNEVYIPASVETIGVYSFKDNYTISKLIFEDTDENPSQLNEIKSQAFENNKLTSVKFPGSLKILGNFIFSSNDFKIGVIPASVTSIGFGIYYYNSELEKIIVKKENFDDVTVDAKWNAATYAGSGVYNYAPYEFNPNYAE